MELDERKKKRAKRRHRDKYRVHYVGGIGYGPLWNNGALYPSTDPTKHQCKCSSDKDTPDTEMSGQDITAAPAVSAPTGEGGMSMGEELDTRSLEDILYNCVTKWYSSSSSPEFKRCFILPDGMFISTPNKGVEPHYMVDLELLNSFYYALSTGDISEFSDYGIDITPNQLQEIFNYLRELDRKSHRLNGSALVEDIFEAIRCNGGNERYIVIDDNIPPTSNQYESLKQWLIKYYEQANRPISVHTSGASGGFKYDEYIQWIKFEPNESSVEDIIKSIKRFYTSGILRENKEEMQMVKYDIKNAFKALKDIEEEDIQLEDKPFERKSLAEKYTKKPLNEEIVKLEPKFDSRQSFYGKAKVDIKDDGTKILWSYNTPVCRIKDGKVTLLRKGYLGWSSSATTLRHVKEFLKQNGFEAKSYQEIAKMYPEEQAIVGEELEEAWKGPHVVEPGSKEHDNLRLACDILNKESVNGISYELETTYFDYGQNWEYTAIIAHDPKHKIWGSTWQVGSPRNWEEIVNADSEEEVRAAVDDLRKSEYFKDVPADFPKHQPMKDYNLSELEKVDDWNGWTIYKVEDKYSINPNTTRKRFDTIDGLKAFLTKRYNLKDESLTESTNIDLTDKEDLEKAKEILDDDTVGADNTEVIVDVDADSIEALKRDYTGQIILQCQKCFTPRFISADGLVKTEDKDEDGHFIYNIEDECPQCGEKAGYIVVGQVSKADSEAAIEAEEEDTHPEDATPVDSIEPDMDILFDEEPEIEEESFNKVFTNYLTETYSNVKSFKLESGTFEGKQFVFEGVIEFESGKTKNVRLMFEGRKANNMLILESIKDSITNEERAFIVEALVEGNKFTTKSLKYSYTTADQLVEGLIK